VYALINRYRVALPLHPEYRTMPMVWYIPPLSPVVDDLNLGRDADDERYVIPPAHAEQAHSLEELATECALDYDGGPGMGALRRARRSVRVGRGAHQDSGDGADRDGDRYPARSAQRRVERHEQAGHHEQYRQAEQNR
jgi:nitrate reductase beta subunit